MRSSILYQHILKRFCTSDWKKANKTNSNSVFKHPRQDSGERKEKNGLNDYFNEYKNAYENAATFQSTGTLRTQQYHSDYKDKRSMPAIPATDKYNKHETDEQTKADAYYKLYHNLFAQQNKETNEQDVTYPPSNDYYDTFLNINKLAEGSLTETVKQHKLSHTNDLGEANMVDVSHKPNTYRIAIAHAKVYLGKEAFDLVCQNKFKKGDVISTAKIAGIMAAKQTSMLIPLCHPLSLNKIAVNVHLDDGNKAIEIECQANTLGKTGVEMEALTGATVTALTVYDMCKSVTHDIVISDIQLVHKSGGVSSYFNKIT